MYSAWDVIRRSALTGFAAGALALAGCSGAQEAADRAAGEQYAQAVASLDQDQLDAAVTAADAAGAVADLSPLMAYKIHALQGQLRVFQARKALAAAQDTELNVSRLLSEVRLATLHVQSAQSQVKSDEQYDPSAIQQQIREKIAQASGGANPQDGELSLSGIDADNAHLQLAIDDNRQQADALAKQKTALMEQADALTQKSLTDAGQPSVDDVTSAAEIRRRAAEAAIEIGKLDATVMNFQADMARNKVQRAGIEKMIAELNAEIAAMDLAWKSVQQDIATQRNLAGVLAGSASEAPTPAATPSDNGLTPPLPRPMTIADRCAALKGLIADVRNQRDQAANELKQAVRNFSVAATAGDLLRAQLSDNAQNERTTPGEKSAFLQLQETYSAASARLAATDAERALATNYAAQAMIAVQAQQALTSAQTILGAAAPANIADCLATIATPSVDDLAQLSEDSFKDAMDHYDGLMVQTLPGPGAASRKTAAMVGKMIAAYGAQQLSLALANKPIAGQTPKELQGVIDDLAKNVADADPTRLPAIPYTIAPTPAPAAQ